MDTLQAMLYRLIDEYASELSLARKEDNFKRPFGALVRQSIPGLLKEHLDCDTYIVKGSVGVGRWTDVPWIAVFDKRITQSAQKGIYIVYLLNKDSKTLFLTLNQGATDVAQGGGSDDKKLAFTGIASSSGTKTTTALREKAELLRKQLSIPDGATYESIKTGSTAYDAGCIFSKSYTVDTLPDDQTLLSDLHEFVVVYEAYFNGVFSHSFNNGGKEELTVKDTIGMIKSYIEARGFSYEDGLIENFYLSLKSKPFVILAGTSGTGKTRLVKLFAEAVGANSSNGRYKMVSVRPDWSDSSDLFGHVDLNGQFIPGAIIDFVKRAELDSSHPYFLCLDEMNLARVEYYLSDFLSVIETRDFQTGHIVSEPLVSARYFGESKGADKYGVVPFPENLYVIGTVNMDETTFPFSRKVLDRANTIEFSFVDLMPPVEWTPATPAPITINNAFLKTEYLLLAQCMDQQESVNGYCAELQQLNWILQQANAYVGYRVRDEIVFYLLNNKNADLLPENQAMDNEIIQKILPRIQGSSMSVKNMLCELFKVCAGDYEGQNTESDLSSKMMKVAQKPDCKYPKSAQKIAFMIGRFEEDGFTSYWL